MILQFKNILFVLHVTEFQLLKVEGYDPLIDLSILNKIWKFADLYGKR